MFLSNVICTNTHTSKSKLQLFILDLIHPLTNGPSQHSLHRDLQRCASRSQEMADNLVRVRRRIDSDDLSCHLSTGDCRRGATRQDCTNDRHWAEINIALTVGDMDADYTEVGENAACKATRHVKSI